MFETLRWYDCSWILWVIELMVTMPLSWFFEWYGDCILVAWNASWWCSDFWVNWSYHLPSRSLLASLPFQRPFHPSEVGCYITLIDFFSKEYVLWCLSCHVPSSYEDSSLYLVIWLGSWCCDFSNSTFLSP